MLEFLYKCKYTKGKNMDSNLREKILKEQDKLIYFSYNVWEEVLLMDHIDDELDFAYFAFNEKFMAQNLDIIPELKSKNLMYLIASDTDVVKETAREILMKRVKEKGEHFFSGENVQTVSHGFNLNLWNIGFNKLKEEDIEYIRNGIFRQLDAIKEKDPYAHSIINKAGYITSMDNFFVLYEQGVFTPEKLQFLERLANENPNILDSINYGIFEDSIFEMGEEFISKIARYPNVSNKLIMIAENNPKLFDTIKQGFAELGEERNKPEVLDIQNRVITYAAKNFPQIEDISFEDLVNCALRVNDASLDKKEHISEAEFEKRCDEEYAKLSQGHISTKYLDAIPEKKKILLMKYFGMDRSQAEEFCNRFGHDIDSIEVADGESKEYLDRVKAVLGLENEEEIDKLYYSMPQKVTPLERIHHEYVLRESYSQTYIEAFGETDDKLSQTPDIEFVEFDGKQVKRINLRGDFNLLVHSTDSGFKGKKEILDGSFAKSWRHITDTNRHLASSCYITQDFLGHVPANENGVLAVFTPTSADDMSLMGPSDIDSCITEFAQISNRGLYMAAQNMPQNTRRVYAEIPVERRDPDYLLIFDDTPEEVLQNSYKAAAEFGIPVIFIDKVEVEKQQLSKLDELTKKFEETQDLSVLSELISMYETNVAGWLLNRDPQKADNTFTKKVDNERFRADFESREAVIYGMVQQYIDQAIQMGDSSNLSQVASIMQTEMEKYNLINIGDTPISHTRMKFDAESILEQIRQRAPEVLPQDNEANNTSKVSEISFSKLAEKISKDTTIGKTEVDKAEEQLMNTLDKEVSLDD